MTRKPDWRERLIALIDEVRRTPYQPGVNDCAIFCARAVQEMTDRDMFPDVPKYTTIEEGVSHLMLMGFDDHEDFVAAHFIEKPVMEALPGDIAVLPGRPNNSLGIVQGEAVYALGTDATGRATIGLVDLSKALRVFSV